MYIPSAVNNWLLRRDMGMVAEQKRRCGTGTVWTTSWALGILYMVMLPRTVTSSQEYAADFKFLLCRFAVSTLGIGLSKYALAGVEAGMLMDPRWAPRNAMQLMAHSDRVYPLALPAAEVC